jgi:hypothetical protein
MMLMLRLIPLILILTGVTTLGNHTDAPPACAAIDETSTDILEDYRWTDTTTDTATVSWRQRSSLPTVAATQIVLVANTTVCRRAVNAYNSILAAQLGDNRQSVSATVIKWGNTRYAVADTLHNAGEWTLHLVTDSSFTQSLSIQRR